MDRSCRELIEILYEARTLLARPTNAFVYSSWNNADEALKEIDGLISAIEGGTLPPMSKVSVLFAPTGPIQEVSIDSGWPHEFIELSKRFDAALEEVYKPLSPVTESKRWWNWWG